MVSTFTRKLLVDMVNLSASDIAVLRDGQIDWATSADDIMEAIIDLGTDLPQIHFATLMRAAAVARYRAILSEAKTADVEVANV